jgi:aldose 1-epimerase
MDEPIEINVSLFGCLENGEEVKKYVLRNKNGFEVSLISLGATVQSIVTKDQNGEHVNVIIGSNHLIGNFYFKTLTKNLLILY